MQVIEKMCYWFGVFFSIIKNDAIVKKKKEKRKSDKKCTFCIKVLTWVHVCAAVSGDMAELTWNLVPGCQSFLWPDLIVFPFLSRTWVSHPTSMAISTGCFTASPGASYTGCACRTALILAWIDSGCRPASGLCFWPSFENINVSWTITAFIILHSWLQKLQEGCSGKISAKSALKIKHSQLWFWPNTQTICTGKAVPVQLCRSKVYNSRPIFFHA